MAYALGTLTAAANVADTETVTIGGKVYTFQATLTNVDGNVKVGADAATSLANLHAAINLGSGAGTAFRCYDGEPACKGDSRHHNYGCCEIEG